MTASTTAVAALDIPFRGLGYYDEEDAVWFFGRETERRTIIGNLRAARLTLLYAESGVGKSSLLRAGVASRLRELAARSAQRGTPRFVPVVFSSWKDEPVAGLITEIEHEANSLLPAGSALSLPRNGLHAGIEAATGALDATLLIILDQFEEHFAYRQAGIQHDRLAAELAACITDTHLHANFLIAIREDAYARLGDLFAGHRVNVYGNYLHLEYLGRTAARAAIAGPIDRFNAVHASEPPVRIEPELTAAVLDDVRRGRLVLGSGDQNGTAGAGPLDGDRDEIEAPFLQLVMTKLWQCEYEQGSRVLRKTTLDRLGGAATIVRTHLDDALSGLDGDELDAATDIFHDLVTPSGAKIALTASDLGAMNRTPPSTVTALLVKLDETRIVRSVEPAPGTLEERYEIFHDRLAAPLLDWVSERDKERLRRQADAERSRARLFRGLAIGSGLLLILAVIAGVAAEFQKRTADRERRTAQSLQLAVDADATLATDPELSTILAVRALRVSDTSQAVQALHNALLQVRELATFDAGANVRGAQFDSDAGKVVTAGLDGTARVWSTTTHRQIAVLVEPGRGQVNDASFNPGATEIVTASSDGTARIWKVTGGRPIATLTEPGRAPIYQSAFSPDGTRIVTAGEDGTARIWDASTDAPAAVLREPSHETIWSAAYNASGSEIVTASSDGTARIWNTFTGTQVRVFAEPSGEPVQDAAFNPAGTEIVTASNDGSARIWNIADRAPVATITEPNGGQLLGAAFGQDGTEIVTASWDGTARIWNAATRTQIAALVGHSGLVRTAVFSPSGAQVLTASYDGTAKLWKATPPEQVGRLTGPGGQAFYHAVFSPNGTEVLTAGSDGTARVWSIARDAEVARFMEPTHKMEPTTHKTIWSAAFNPSATDVVTASADGTARIWNVASGRPVATLGEPGGAAIYDAQFNPSGTEVVTASQDGTARVWSATTGAQIQPALVPPTHRAIWSAAFNPNGSEIVTTGDDGTARIWGATTHTQLGVIDEPGPAPIYAAAISPDEREVVTASSDGTARIWSAISDRQLGMLTEPANSRLSDVAFSPAGGEIVTASSDGTARIWSASTGRQLTVFTEPGNGALRSAAFNPHATEVVTAAFDGTARIWSTTLTGSLRSLQRVGESMVTRPLTAGERAAYLAGA